MSAQKIATVLFFLLAFFVGGSNIYYSFNKKAEIVVIPTDKPDLKKYWKSVVAKNPNYRDGYLELFKLEAAEGNYFEAYNALSQAKKVDPNSQKVKEYEDKALSLF